MIWDTLPTRYNVEELDSRRGQKVTAIRKYFIKGRGNPENGRRRRSVWGRRVEIAGEENPLGLRELELVAQRGWIQAMLCEPTGAEENHWHVVRITFMQQWVIVNVDFAKSGPEFG